ncbi:MAG: TlpA disulfide reductase family protein [Bacteroidota bacterium]
MSVNKQKVLRITGLLLVFLLLLTPLGFYTKIQLLRLWSAPPDNEAGGQLTQRQYQSWFLKDDSGNLLSFDQFERKVVFVNFWATWCAPCVAEMPSLQALYEQYGRKVHFVSIAKDDPKAVKQFLEKNPYTFPVYFLGNSPPELLHAHDIPVTYILDRNARIALQNTGAADWNTTVVHQMLDSLTTP